MKKFLLFYLIFLSTYLFAQKNTFQIPYELKGYNITMTYDEIIQHCNLVDSLYDYVSFKSFGKSAQGDDLPYLMIDNGIEDKNKLTLWIQAGIHPGEPEGVEAGFLFLRELMTNPEMTKLLNKVRIVYIPCFNVDGLKRFGPYNRINQNGPEQMGWRTTAQNYNLNRDFMKADAPEMQAWLRLYNFFNPDFLIDCHTTDGADYQYAITYGFDTYQTMNESLASWCTGNYLPFITENMKKDGYPIMQYVSFRQWHNPRSGLMAFSARPMLSHGYTILSDRPCLLIETHMLKPYKVRVESTLRMILHTFTFLAQNNEKYRNILINADMERVSDKFLNTPLPIALETSMKDSSMIDFLGVEFDTVKSNITGGIYYKYDNTKPQTWKIPFFDKIVVSRTVKLPLAYLIPVEWTDVIERLKLHGVEIVEVAENSRIQVRATKFYDVQFPPTGYEGRFRPGFSMTDFDTTINIHKGSALVLVRQSKVKVLANLLEAASEDSFLKWGFFNAIFEQKEYGEIYVLEPMAEAMFAENPKLKTEFEEMKIKDKNFASNQWLQMNWIYNKTIYRDQNYCLYPVYKILSKSELDKVLPIR